ncbi:MAG: MiaB/RimO family radical SAM methylthiotransferase, partial [Patescibacteria group bacterium]
DVMFNTVDMATLPRLLGLTSQDSTAESATNADYLALPVRRGSPFSAYVPIMTGCNNFCTFCAVPYTRGEEVSRPSGAVLSEVRNLASRGYREITLLGQNVNAYIDPEEKHTAAITATRARARWEYRADVSTPRRSATTTLPKDFAELLRSADAVPGDFWIRFLTSNPQDVSPELIAALPSLTKVTRYFHLPIQSGDDQVLRRMNRRHTRADYLELVQKIRTSWPGVALTTDVIVGFPGETWKQFQNTLSLAEQVQYDMAFIAEYSPRPGTAAARFFPDDVPAAEKKRRWHALNEVVKRSALGRNTPLVGTTVRVLADRYSTRTQLYRGRTETLKPIRFSAPTGLVGQFIPVKVTGATAWNLSGSVASNRKLRE